jgi:hypothetical protein
MRTRRGLINEQPNGDADAPPNVRFWGTADNGGFWPATVCPLMMWWTAPTLRHRSAIGWLR